MLASISSQKDMPYASTKVMSPPVLGWVVPEADSEIRIGVQVGYLEGDLARGNGDVRQGRTGSP